MTTLVWIRNDSHLGVSIIYGHFAFHTQIPSHTHRVENVYIFPNLLHKVKLRRTHVELHVKVDEALIKLGAQNVQDVSLERIKKYRGDTGEWGLKF